MKTIPCWLCCMVVFGGMTVPARSDATAELGRILQSIQEKYSIVGLSTAVVNGGIIWHTNLGMADIERSLPVTPESKFRIASISKIATSIALMQLWEEGKLQLDDDISRHLGYSVINPRFADKPITIRHLLTHTSSLLDGPTYDKFLMATYHAADRAKDLRELIHAEGESYNDGAIFSAHAPGTHYHYSNLAFGILGTLVEKFSGERFDVYCRKNIFEPLGIEASFNPADLRDISQLGVLYRPGENGWNAQFDNHKGVSPGNRIGPNYRPGRNAIVFSPQGGLRISALDLAKFMMQFMEPFPNEGRRVLKQSTIELMMQENWNGGDESALRARGLGFEVRRDIVPGELWVGHGGNAYGLLSKMLFRPGGDTGFVLITSGSKPGQYVGDLFEMERELIDALCGFLNGSMAAK